MVPWLPLGAVVLHLIEEFAWPGGFPAWYRRYVPSGAASITTSRLLRVNALFVAMAAVAGILFPRPYGVALWLIVASIGAANAFFHLWATVKMREYSPGLVTGLLLYLPLAAYGFYAFAVKGLASRSTLAQAALVGPAYHLYLAYRHRRRAATLESS